MPRRSGPLARLSVPKPCAADWDSMVGTEQIRFCAHCALHVHNLSAMRNADARRLLRKFKGSLCVRYHLRPDGSPQTLDTAPRLHQIARRVSRLAAGTFGAVLTLSAGALAQQGSAPRADAPPGVAASATDAGAVLTGTIYDAAGAAIPNVSLTAYRDNLQAFDVVTNAEGVYRFESLPPGKYTLTASAEGFVAGTVPDLELARGGVLTLDATLEVQGPQETLEVTEEVDVVSVVSGGAMRVLPKTPLVRAAFDDDLAAVKQLLAAGAYVNALDEDTETSALAEAVENGNAAVVAALLGAGADVNLRDASRRTALMSLDEDASADLARALLAAGGRVELRDESGDTALIEAAGTVREEVLRVLLDAGADVNASNDQGRTALMEAAAYGNLEHVRALVQAGADMNRQDEDGATALKLARDNGHEEIVALLTTIGAVEE